MIPENYDFEDLKIKVKKLAGLLGVTVVLKSNVDIVSDGDLEGFVSSEGSKKRCGGQGDILCGVMATLLAWNKKSANHKSYSSEKSMMSIHACQCALYMVKTAAADTCNLLGRGMVANDIIANLHAAFRKVFELE